MGDSSSSSASYIRMVIHEEKKKPNPPPPFLTDLLFSFPVWAELEKENKEFFEAYSKNREESVMEMRTVQMIRTVLTRMASRDPDEDED
ncbi:hypothetical protein BHE74_00002696 [Ensete ventricosum]|nr:hypothetical protein BHE74_00002696 [Ensete ventricosum]